MSELFWYHANVEMKVEVCSLVQVTLKSKTVTGLVLEVGYPDLPFKTKPIVGLAAKNTWVSPSWVELLQWLSRYYLTPLPQVLSVCLPKFAWRFLFAEPPKLRVSRKKKIQMVEADASALILNSEQHEAINAIAEPLSKNHFQPFLLHGITGSGKTLVYLHLAKQAIEQGKNVLVLLPEIALTPQTLGRFQAFLDQKVYAFHSNLGVTDRRELWKALFAKTARVIVGARSAVLCPMDNIGLIIVDEEHDGSYKQSEMAPRYQARDVAVYRAKQMGCPVILGSATPSLESYYAAQTGKFTLLTMNHRATGVSSPTVRLVDMREQFELQGPLPLSIPLREAMQKALEKNEQIILFLNRRGYAHRRVCQGCGSPQQCQNCALPLVVHKKVQKLKCHYCDFSLSYSAPCQACGSPSFLEVGRGIEKIEEYIKQIFPAAGISRLDRDTTDPVGGPDEILQEFKSGVTQILLGTQMVAKGHDFPRVNLVGVLDADMGLGMSDFRAQERSFQLITQVSGRAGRHHAGGQVFLQTFKADNPILQFALTHHYENFYAAEIEMRQELQYPPFRRLLLVEISGEDEHLVLEQMQQFAEIFKVLAEKVEAIVLGPSFAVLKRIKRQYRAHLIAKGKAPNQLQWLMEESLKQFKADPSGKTRVRADMDPVALM